MLECDNPKYNSIANIHEPIARVLGNLTGWDLLPGHAGWWMIPAVLVGGWVMVRLMLDVAESRFSLLSYFMAVVCFLIGAACSLGWSPTLLADWPGILNRTLPLGSHLCLFCGTLLYSRYIVLDVQGLINHETSRPSSSEVANEPSPKETKVALTAPPKETLSKDWVDGSQPEPSEEMPQRRLSKAERKRLRKQKNQKRAA